MSKHAGDVDKHGFDRIDRDDKLDKKRRRPLSEMNQPLIGAVGLGISILLLAVALNIGKVIAFVSNSTYTADFSEAGGLRGGDEVRVDGLTVGKVGKVQLQGNQVKVTFALSGVRLGEHSRAAVKSNNALGSKFLDIDPQGSGEERNIPRSHTDPGISVNAELGQLTADTAQIDVSRLAQSFESLSQVLSATPPQFRSALQGVSALSTTISSRDTELATLLQKADSVSSVLAQRNQQITGIVADGGQFFAELEQRREVIGELLHNVQLATQQLTALVRDNKDSLKPALTQLRQASQMLVKYRNSIDYGLKNTGVYARALGESVGSGPFFQAYVPNLTDPESIATSGVAGIIKQALGG